MQAKGRAAHICNKFGRKRAVFQGKTAHSAGQERKPPSVGTEQGVFFRKKILISGRGQNKMVLNPENGKERLRSALYDKLLPFRRLGNLEFFLLPGKRMREFECPCMECKPSERICFCAVVVVAGKRISL